MKTLYTDASFDWNSTNATDENIVRGKIAISDGSGYSRVEKFAIGKVDGLKQYINIFELTAIARAVELAYDMNITDKQLEIFTDSMTAMYWARNGKIKPSVLTLAHAGALDYLRRAVLNFGGVVTFNFVPREKNPAGHLLQEELENGSKPHDL